MHQNGALFNEFGDIIVPTKDKLIYVAVEDDSPAIRKILAVKTKTDDLTGVIKKAFTNDGRVSRRKLEVANQIIENVGGQRLVLQFRRSNYRGAPQLDRYRERGQVRSDTYHDRIHRGRREYHLNDQKGILETTVRYRDADGNLHDTYEEAVSASVSQAIRASSLVNDKIDLVNAGEAEIGAAVKDAIESIENSTYRIKYQERGVYDDGLDALFDDDRRLATENDRFAADYDLTDAPKMVHRSIEVIIHYCPEIVFFSVVRSPHERLERVKAGPFSHVTHIDSELVIISGMDHIKRLCVFVPCEIIERHFGTEFCVFNEYPIVLLEPCVPVYYAQFPIPIFVLEDFKAVSVEASVINIRPAVLVHVIYVIRYLAKKERILALIEILFANAVICFFFCNLDNLAV